MEVAMIAPLRPGITLARPDGPLIETERLVLRQWSGADIAPNTAMLADPSTARFITIDGKPVTDELIGWRNAAVMAGHWALHGAGMFVVEEKQTGKFPGGLGRGFRRAGRASRSAGASRPSFAAEVLPSRRRARQSTGRSRPSSSTGSSISSTATTQPRKRWHGGSALNPDARSTCSATSRRSG
jgi:hypothetical protein